MKARNGRSWTDKQKRGAKIRSWFAANHDIIDALIADAKLVKMLKLKIHVT